MLENQTCRTGKTITARPVRYLRWASNSGAARWRCLPSVLPMIQVQAGTPYSGTFLAPGNAAGDARNGVAGRRINTAGVARHLRSGMTAIVSLNQVRTAGPTLPRLATILLVETARRCWH